MRPFFKPKRNRSAAAQSAPATRAFDEDGFILRTFGLHPDQVTQTAMTGGLSRLSLTRFSGPDGPFLIRKTIAATAKTEADFMGALSMADRGAARHLRLDWTLPQVYAVADEGACFNIYMQRVEGIAHRHGAQAGRLAEPLAKAMYELSLILPVVCLQAGLTPPDRGSPGEAFFAKTAVYLRRDVEPLREIVRLNRSLPKQISHNDIYWPNMGVTGPQETPQFRFIDFGMLGLNVAGAELHHFARHSVRTGPKSGFFLHLCKHYAALARLDPVLIEMNALFYAAMRLMAFETTNSGVSQPPSDTVARLLHQVLAAYGRLGQP